MVITKQSYQAKEMDFYHVFQPIFDLSKNKAHGYEVLLRSNNFSNPELFFKQAKEQNILFELDMGSIFKACETFKQKKLRLKDVYLFINIFPSTLVNSEFYTQLNKLKSMMEIIPGHIVIEINEAEKKEDLLKLQEVVSELKSQGFLIALDDLGKGESTLQSVIDLKPDIIKLDRYYAKELSTSQKKQDFIKKVVQIVGKDVSLVLEGIEHQEDLLVAKSLDVPFIQGFLLGKPEPLEYYM